jgi:CheY-like chemotaxis protein/HPt (histidine-containing phosphotransfer) domain-containing protein
MIEKMQGTVWIESELDHGSTFHFTAKFKLQRGVMPSPAPPVLSRFRDLSVLVVEGNNTNRRLLHDLLSQWHMKVSTVESGQAALASLDLAQDNGKPFELVLLDAHMADLNGTKMVEEIRLHSREARVILMLRADSLGDPCPGTGTEIAICLTKPIRSPDLLNAIAEAFSWSLEQRGYTTAPSSANYSSRCPPLRILLAEDNEINQRVAVGILEQQGHTVTVAANGSLALGVLEQEEFDLILMDSQMPVMTGMEAVTKIRLHEQATGLHVPIIAMTAHAMEGDRQRCIDAGMDGYLAKPIRSRELLESIEDLMTSLRGPLSLKPEHVPNGVHLDREVLLGYVGGNPELLRSIVRLFLRNCPDMLMGIRSAIAARDSDALKMAAHTLRGSGSNFFTTSAIRATNRLEEMEHDPQFLSAGEELSTLEKEIALVEPELTALVAEV